MAKQPHLVLISMRFLNLTFVLKMYSNLINVITKYNQKLKQDIDFQTKIKQFINQLRKNDDKPINQYLKNPQKNVSQIKKKKKNIKEKYSGHKITISFICDFNPYHSKFVGMVCIDGCGNRCTLRTLLLKCKHSRQMWNELD